MPPQNPLETELNQWSRIILLEPSDPKPYIQRGMVNFKLAKIAESIQDFDQAEKLDSRLTPYLWQRGLSYYYAERFAEGAKQFEVDLSVNPHDVEETVWRYLCQARLSSATEARQKLLPVKNDPRRVMQRVYNLFAGNGTPDDVLAVDKSEGKGGLFYSHLYLGLYYEASGDGERSRHYITTAVSKYTVDDYMWHVANVHRLLRGWS